MLVIGGNINASYVSSEEDAILGFVASGGALLVYLNGGMSFAIDVSITERFGIKYDGNHIVSPIPGWAGAASTQFWLADVNHAHPIGMASYCFAVSRCGSLIITSPAVPIANSGPETRRDTNGNRIPDASEPMGPFTIIAASEYGAGRVVVMADDYFKPSCNAQLIYGAVSWLLGNIW
jgi:hypothetical protein